jgi:uncharacterized membrane protein (DUF485 family)
VIGFSPSLKTPNVTSLPFGFNANINTREAEETTMDEKLLARIQSDPNYQTLVRERSSFGWTLAIIILVVYYGYVGIVAFAPSLIATTVSGSITIGIILGAGLIVFSILITGVYIVRANSRYDELTREVVASATGAAR